jgi:hypothetical protein
MQYMQLVVVAVVVLAMREETHTLDLMVVPVS